MAPVSAPATDGARTCWQFGPFVLAPEEYQLTAGGSQVPVTRKALALLCLLIEHRHRVLTFDEMLHRVWGTTARSRGVVAQVVKQIRVALDDDADAPRWIRSYHGVGYRFVGEVETAAEPADAAAGNEELQRLASASSGRLSDLDAALARGNAPEGTPHALFAQGLDVLDRHDAHALDQVLEQLRVVADRAFRSTARLYVAALAANRALSRGEFKAAQQSIDEGRGALDIGSHPAARIDFQISAARAAIANQSYRDALLSLEVAWSLAVDHGTTRQTAMCAQGFGFLLSHLYLYALAGVWLERARAIAHGGGHHTVEARSELNLLAIRVAQENDLLRLGRTDREAAWRAIVDDIQHALERHGRHDLPDEVVAAFRANLGIALGKLGRTREAAAQLRSQIEFFERVHVLDRFAATSYYLADMQLKSGDAQGAVATCLHGIAVCERHGRYPIGYRNLMDTVAEAFAAAGDHGSAASYLAQRSRSGFELEQARIRDEATQVAMRLHARGKG